jgi:large exoprotein involved in heme utilization and adhesion
MNENAGNIVINSNSLILQDDSIIASLTSGTGNTGDITIQTEDTALVKNSGFETFTEENSKGNSGNIAIQTDKFYLNDGSFIDSSTSGEGNAGNIVIQASDVIRLDQASIKSQVFENGLGKGGNVNILAGRFDINNSSVLTITAGEGNAGNVTIKTLETIADADNIDEENSTISNISIFSRVAPGAVGNGGNISIISEELSLDNGAVIDSSTLGLGNAGNISIISEELSLDNGAVIDSSTFGLGNAGNIEIQTEEINLNGGSIFSQVGLEGEGDGGDISIDSESFSLTRGGQINASIFGTGKGGNISVNALDFVEISGVNAEGLSSGLSANSEESAIGNPGSITVETNTLNINGGIIEANNQGEGNSQEADNNNIFETNIFLRSNNLLLNNGASISAITESGDGGNADILVQEQIWLGNNSDITVGSFGAGNGGNVNIDAQFIVAFSSRLPGNGNDIIAYSVGSGGNVNIQADRVFGIEPRIAISGNGSNDFDASAELNIEEGIVVNIFDSVALPPTNLVEQEQTSAQACQADRETAAKSGLTIKDKGGVPPAPDLPLNSQSISIDGEIDPTISTIPEPIETSIGKIQPARGIKVTKDGRVTLTAYRTNNAGERIPEIEPNCR